MTFTPNPVTASYQAGTFTTFQVTATPTTPSEFAGTNTLYAFVVDPNKVVTGVAVAQAGISDSYVGTLTTSSTVAAGTYTGNFQLQLCSDSQCNNQFPGSPWSEAYSITVTPGGPPASGDITTVAGIGTSGYSGDGGPATSAALNLPNAVAFDSSGNYYISDWLNGRIRKVDTSGNISTAVAAGQGPLAIDASSNIYFSNGENGVVFKYTVSTGVTTTFAGTGPSISASGDGGPATSATISPQGIAFDASGNLYIADLGDNRIRKVNTLGVISTVAGNGTLGYSGDGGPATSAELYNPSYVAVDASGNLYISDERNNRIRKVSTAGTITTIAGTGVQGYSGDGGAATSATMYSPQGIQVDASGNVYFVDQGNNVVRKISTSGTITTIAGNGTTGYSGNGGLATQAELRGPDDIAFDANGDLYISDTYNFVIRRVQH